MLEWLMEKGSVRFGNQACGVLLTRVMSRLKALYRGWAIPCAGQPRLRSLIVQLTKSRTGR